MENSQLRDILIGLMRQISLQAVGLAALSDEVLSMKALLTTNPKFAADLENQLARQRQVSKEAVQQVKQMLAVLEADVSRLAN